MIHDRVKENFKVRATMHFPEPMRSRRLFREPLV